MKYVGNISLDVIESRLNKLIVFAINSFSSLVSQLGIRSWDAVQQQDTATVVEVKQYREICPSQQTSIDVVLFECEARF